MGNSYIAQSNRLWHESIVEIRDVFQECEKFNLSSCGVQQNEIKRCKISYKIGR